MILQVNAKMYWSVLKTFFNGKKVPIIRLLLINNKVSDFEVKANYFNGFSASQCTSLNNRSSVSDCNWTRTQNHTVRKRTLKHFTKLAK